MTLFWAPNIGQQAGLQPKTLLGLHRARNMSRDSHTVGPAVPRVDAPGGYAFAAPAIPFSEDGYGHHTSADPQGWTEAALSCIILNHSGG